MYRITSRFNQQESFRHFAHNGIDFAFPLNEPIRTIRDGVVEQITHYPKGQNIGNGVLVRWDDGKVSIYGHMSKVNEHLHVGERVHTGDLLGYAGDSGHAYGVHLHFGLKEGGRFIDPSPYISDIQNMNIHIAKHIAEHVPEVVPTKVNFFDYMHQHMNVLSDLKMHLIHLPYDTLFIQIGKQLLQFMSAHSSFLNFIIGHLF